MIRLAIVEDHPAIAEGLTALLGGELDVPDWVRRRFPATLHLDLLPEARGQGIGRQLFERYIAAMRAAGVRGIHAQTLSVNAPIARFNAAVGFRIVASRGLHAYCHLDGQPIQIHTWVMGV